MRGFGIARGRALRASLIIGVVTATLVALAAPAWACDVIVSGTTTCTDGAHVVTWTFQNSESDKMMSINYALAATPSHMYTVSGWSPTVGFNGSTSATTTVPGNDAGPLNIDVSASWDNGFTNVDYGSVDLGAACPAPPTTTTTTQPPTTTTPPVTPTTEAPPPTDTTPTTEAPPPTDTTPTTEAPPTTKVAGTTIVVTTTPPKHSTTTTAAATVTTVGQQGGGLPTTSTKPTGAKELPFTGSSTAYVIFFGLCAVAAGGALLLHKRSAMPLHTGAVTPADARKQLERRRRALSVYLPRR
jgi:hypothetical protein